VVSEKNPQPPEDEPPKKFRITRKRLGTIRFIDPKGEFGFIEAEDFRDDVFFHHSVVQHPTDNRAGPLSGQASQQDEPGPYGRRPQRPVKLNAEEMVTKHVEFEIDDELFETEQRLRATVVRPTRRPMGKKLSGRDATFKIVTHHPKARRKRPDWRG
jgi:hypothetical protein